MNNNDLFVLAKGGEKHLVYNLCLTRSFGVVVSVSTIFLSCRNIYQGADEL